MKTDERVILNFNLYAKDVYNSYGVDDRPLLNDELAYTIEEQANNHKIKTNLAINFKKFKKSAINEETFVDAYQNSFNSRIRTKKHELSRCVATGAVMLLVGILMLLFDVFVAEPFMNYFWYEFFNVFAWVFCWGGIEVLTVELVQIQMEIGKIRRLTNAEINFTLVESEAEKHADKNIETKPTVTVKKSAKF